MSKLTFESLEEAIAHIEKLNAELKASNEALKAANKELEAERKVSGDALAQVTEMGEKLDVLEKNKGSKNLIVSIKGKNYELIGLNFRTPKGRLTAEQLSKDEALLAEMLKKKSGALVPAK